MPLLAKSSAFFFLFVSESRFFGVLSTPFPDKEILDYIAHGFLRRVNIALKVMFPAPSFEVFRECHPVTRYRPGMHVEVFQKPRAEQLDHPPPKLPSTSSLGSFFNLNVVRNSQYPSGYYPRIRSFRLHASRLPANAASLLLSQPTFDIHGMRFRKQFLFLVVM